MTRTPLAALLTLGLFAQTAHAADSAGLPPIRKLTEEQSKVAAANYKKYCVLCHGEDRQGHVNDHAPSLRSKSLFESGVPHAVLRPIQYGRQGTAMGGYLDEAGGPMTLKQIGAKVGKDSFMGRGTVAQALAALESVGKIKTNPAPDGTPQLKKVDFITYEAVDRTN